MGLILGGQWAYEELGWGGFWLGILLKTLPSCLV